MDVRIWESRRATECAARLPGQCANVNMGVGFTVAVSPTQCDTCFSAGKTEWPGYVAKVVEAAKARPSVVPQAQRALFEELHGPIGNPGPSEKDRWDAVRHTWEMGESFVRSMVSRGLTGKRVELPVLRVRHRSCFGAGAPSPQDVSGDYTKLMYPYLECPEERPGFSNEKPGQTVTGDPCPHLGRSKEGGQAYCNGCRCGDTAIARLGLHPNPR